MTRPLTFCVLLLAACTPVPGTGDTGETSDTGGTGDTGDTGDTSEACEPSADVFEANILPILEQRCQKCHGDTPQFGAPNSMVEFEDLIALAASGDRSVAELLIDRTGAAEMPPIGEPELTHSQLDTLTGWASCGQEHPHPAESLVASAPVHEAPEDPPADAERVVLAADEFPVGPGLLDYYHEVQFADIVESDKFIRRIEVELDDSRVVHHVTLTDEDGSYLYAWAPGGGAVQFPEGGIRVTPEDVFVVQTHYNNGAGATDVYDSTGVALYLSDPVGTEYAQVDPQTWDIFVPAQGTSTATADCTAVNDFTLFAGMPHMHNTGSTFSTTVRRSGGEEISVIEISGWVFDAQRYYDYDGLEVNMGDHVIVKCGYENNTDSAVFAGLDTTDEMCFDFIYVTPADALLVCAP